MWVRGLKRVKLTHQAKKAMSHPMWVRGLKPWRSAAGMIAKGRILCGCVD